MSADTQAGPRRRSGRPVPQPGPRPAADYDRDPAEPMHDRPTRPAHTATPPPTRAPRAREPRPTTTAAQRRAQRAKGAETESGALDKRITLTLPAEQKRWLAMARVDDEVETNARIRAMIQIWHDDPKFRERVDRLAPEHMR